MTTLSIILILVLAFVDNELFEVITDTLAEFQLVVKVHIIEYF